jgi:hypothetical protein
MKFRTKLEQSGKTATGIRVPDKIVESLGAGKKPPVRVTINGYTYRSSVAVLGGVFMVGVSAEVREKAGVAGGEMVDVELELDSAPREVTVPPELKSALKKDAKAAKFFDTLSYSNKRRIVLGIESAKTAETRARRIDKAVSSLRQGKM